jgi:poly(A) polymerase
MSTSVYLEDRELVRELDEVDIRVISACTLADELIALVPQPIAFRHALRTIKLWAKRKFHSGHLLSQSLLTVTI